MSVIALVGNKGGAGKTTLSVNLAIGLAKNSSVVLLDADPQASSLQWQAMAEAADALPVESATHRLDQQVRDFSASYQHVVIDCPPSVDSPQTGLALQVANLALVPVQPSPVDLWATVHIEQAVDRAHGVNPDLRAMLVINQLEPRTILSRVVGEALSEIALPLAKTAIRRRAIYRSSALEGKSVFTMGRRGADAATELELLIEEVIQS